MKAAMLFSSFVFALISFSCTKNSVTDPVHIIDNPTPSTVPTTVNKSMMLNLVNEIRKTGCQCGDTYYYSAPPVTWNNQLELAAYNHSSDMYKNNFFSHTGLDGSNGGVRIERAGYKWTAYAENIANGYTTERSVVDGWIKSPAHCKNLMNRTYKEMGVAKIGAYWTQEFATRQ
ncbi:MAG: CAP domain-containing protein [Chitinophagaceae bacterium]